MLTAAAAALLQQAGPLLFQPLQRLCLTCGRMSQLPVHELGSGFANCRTLGAKLLHHLQHVSGSAKSVKCD